MNSLLQSILALLLVLCLSEMVAAQWGYGYPYGGYGGYGMGGYGGYGMGGGWGWRRRMMMGMYNPYMYGK